MDNITMEVDGDVTINGIIVNKSESFYTIKLKSGRIIEVDESDINTYRPKLMVNNIDMRKGN